MTHNMTLHTATGVSDTTRGQQQTGIIELDHLLHGGIPIGSAVLLSGQSGTGKTILATQWLFEGYQQYHEPGIYISLTEPVAKAIRNAKKLAFFDPTAVGPLQVYFTDLRGIMQGLDITKDEFSFEDIGRIVETIKNMVAQSGAKRVVLDSVTAIAYHLKDRSKVRDFIFQIGTALSQQDVNIILTSETPGAELSVFGTEEFISDGIIRLSFVKTRSASSHQLEVVKMRGTDYEQSPAAFRISRTGIAIFPRLERELSYPISEERISTGPEGLDAMTGGGYLKGSTILVSGASGTGKTIMGLHFLASGLKRGERALLVSFEESRDQLMHTARSFGWDFARFEKEGLLQIICAYPEERYMEEHLQSITRALEASDADRIVVDSLSALEHVFTPESLPDFSSRLINYCKNKGTTSYFTAATSGILGAGEITEAHLSTFYDTIVLLRFIEVQSEIKHGVLLLKIRASAHDKKLREFIFTEKGLQVLTSFSGYEGALGGEVRKVSKTIEEQLRDLLTEIWGPLGEKIFKEEQRKGLSPSRIQKLIQEFGDQGIISARRNKEYVDQLRKVLEQ